MKEILHFQKKNQRGVALLLVLGALILISAIIIGFLTTVRQDRSSSAYYENGSTARQYADTAVNVAIAQIADATSNPNEAWISQPGLLRTFDTSGPVAAYKLYSSGTMKVLGAYNPEIAMSSEIPPDWSNRLDEFTDLNQPVQVTTSGSTQLIYPIVDGTAANSVEGFSIDTNLPGATGTDANLLPMPVRWIYVRSNGSLVDYGTAKTSNDIMARIAFWGDDETCKVNINTAADGVYYDSPVANTKQDHDLGRYQPIAQEYQRFPGHPATTSLASVFKEIRQTDPVLQSLQASQITPRIGWGGSEGGTKQAWLLRNLGVLDFDRLYPSIDEASFGKITTGTSAQWLPGVAPDDLRSPSSVGIDPKRLSFFLTTDSRGPELNIFNRPRLTLWPFNKELVTGSTPSQIQNSSLLMTPEDRLIRFASEIGCNDSTAGTPTRKLYFQRDDAWEPMNDYANIPENQQLYSYLQWATQNPIPGNPSRTGGASANFGKKFTLLGRDQILTEMFDYLRCQVNTMNRSYEPVGGPVYSFPQGHDLDNTGFNDRCPILIDAGNGMTKGLGSGGLTLSEFIMQFYNATTTTGTNPITSGMNVAEIPVDLMNNTTGVEVPDGKPDSIIRRVQLVVLLDFWMSVNTLNSAMPRFQVELKMPQLSVNPNPNGVPLALTDRIYARVSGSTTWSTGSVDLGLLASATNVYCSNHTIFDTGASNMFGGSMGLSYGLRYSSDGLELSDILNDTHNGMKTLGSSASVDYTKYPFVSQVIEFRIPLKAMSSGTVSYDSLGKPVTLSDPTVVGLETVAGANSATVRVFPALKKNATTLSTLQSGADYLQNYLQKATVAITNCSFPLPKLGPDSKLIATSNASLSPQYKYSDLSDYSKRLEYVKALPADTMMLVPNGLEGGAAWVPKGTQTMMSMDSFRSFGLSVTGSSGGDFRIAALNRDLSANWFEPNHAYASGSNYLGMNYIPYFLTRGNSPGTSLSVPLEVGSLSGVNPTNDIRRKISNLIGAPVYADGADPRTAAPTLAVALKSNGSAGDYTNGYGFKGDGGMVKGPDIGAITRDASGEFSPYFSNDLSRSGTADNIDINHTNFTGLVYSPWKQMPSPVRFGTLPSRALSGNPWETLLFNPVPAGGQANHRGWSDFPRDHYWLDLFYMPVVEPYAITENLATNGKINLNQQIAPFTYIRRNTGLWALLRNMKVLAIPETAAATYKLNNNKYTTASAAQYRKPVDIASTVALFQDRLSKLKNDPFVSASEVCEIPMLFDGKSESTIYSYWDSFKLTGDDGREAPYNAIYPRVTTRSNTYRIHFCAQTLKGKPGQWTVMGQYRGSQVIERYLDIAKRPYDASLKGNADTASGLGADFPALAGNDSSGVPFYRFRKLSHQQFAP